MDQHENRVGRERHSKRSERNARQKIDVILKKDGKDSGVPITWIGNRDGGLKWQGKQNNHGWAGRGERLKKENRERYFLPHRGLKDGRTGGVR